MHILPKRFVRIRHYGFLTNRGKVTRINEIRKNMELEAVTLKVETIAINFRTWSIAVVPRNHKDDGERGSHASILL